ncbi:hypothetical protein [Subtercola vilae]|uniref:SbsA Ig-like domain-containing protein n=1 Tax=Subtercola vilae TaxID=2056433 RepID=A0A4T2BYY9_9MICO|nr:hypothetical protein [Subtercola vilae]TIH36619.1 hypothetical protein D4765_09625 [Subtercola vilae]
MSAAVGLPGDAGSVRAAWVEGAVIVNGRALPGLPDLTRGSAAHGSADAWPRALAVVPADAVLGTADLVAMAGSWQREIGGLRFTPRFAAAPGSVFVVARRDPASGVWAECARVAVPGGPPPRLTTVVSIDPGGGEVPANLLRFAVTFSHEMPEGSSAGQLRLLDANGTEIAGALYDLPPELWDRSRRRLTALLEPGRIKRGLQPNAVVGAPLVEGATVTFSVGSGLLDARGALLSTGASRSFRVAAPVRSRVDPARWELRWAACGASRGCVLGGDALVVRFERPLDRALALSCIRLRDGRGHPVPGMVSVSSDGSEWAFAPAAITASASRADWRLHIATRLEDLAGNSVRRVFDRDLRLREDDGIDAAEVVRALPA